MRNFRKFIPKLFLVVILFLGITQSVSAAPNIETVDASVTGSSVVSLQLDAAGFPVIAYQDNGTGLIVIHCNDLFCAGNDESSEVVVAPPIFASFPSMQLDSSGNPVISFYDEALDDLLLLHCNDVNCAGNDESIETVDSSGIVGRYTSLQLDSSGNPVISYFSDSGGDLRLAHCNDVNCAGNDESIVTIDGPDQVGANNRLVLDASGNPIIAYYDTTNDSYKLVHCNDVNCVGNDESIETVSSTGLGGIQVGLELDAAGNPIIAFLNDTIPTSPGMELIHCNDVNCAGNDESIATLDAFGNFPSMQLDSSGNPIISYIPSDVDHLAIIACTNDNCTGSNGTRSIVDNSIQGWTNSMVLDASDNPVIAYLDINNNILKLARCDTSTCATPRYWSSPVANGVITIQGQAGTTQSGTLVIRNLGDASSQLDVNQVGALTNFSISALPTGLQPSNGNFIVTVSCTIPQVTETLTVQSNESTNPTYSYTLNCVQGTTPALPASNNTQSVNNGDIQIFDPAISKIGFLVPGQVGVTGEQLEWIVTVQNPSAVVGQNVIITDNIDPRLQIDRVEAIGANVTINGQTVTVNYTTLNSGESVSFSIFTTVLDGINIENTACIDADNQAMEECFTGTAISQLPETGETPHSRKMIVFISGLILLSLLGKYSIRKSVI